MPKRKKYPKLPNGYGSIRFLGKGRRNPYAVHPPTTEFTLDGTPKMPKAICYVSDYMTGFAVLTAYNAGNYYPGYEKTVSGNSGASEGNIMQRILADYNLTKAADEKLETKKETFSDVFQMFFDWKFNQDQSRHYSKSSRNSTLAAFKNCSALHDLTFSDLRHQDMQDVIDRCPLKHSSKELIVSLFHQMYKYAEIYELCDRDHSAHVRINTEDDDEHGIPFSEEELRILWAHKDNSVVGFILIMCYSGYRIKAYDTMEVNLEEKYFKGGVKTASSKDRIVPIHSAILPLVSARIATFGRIADKSPDAFRNAMYDALSALGIEKHTPHDCRHTFSSLCEKYGVNENDRKRMLGHSFGGDITNQVYGHRDVEDLRAEIEKIKVFD